MDLARARRLNDLCVAVSGLGAEERAAFLGRLRAEDPAMADELAAMLRDVEQLVAATREDTSALDEVLGERELRAAQHDLQAIASDPHELGVPPDAIEGFRLVRRIGQGGMGVVYEAEQDNPRRRVALKLMQPSLGTERLRRFELEGAVLGRLHHPNIAQVYACGTFRGPLGEQPFIAMELIDGVDLRTHAERAKLSLQARLALFAQVADGVHHAHDRGVVHRDLKPDNVLVDPLGTAKVLDFGIARAKDSSLDLTSMATQAGVLIGTLSYMAPEQLAGDPDAITVRSDVYSLGVMLYELLSNRLPHEVAGLPISAAIHTLMKQPPAPLARFDARLRGDLATITAKAMERDPARRYASAADLAADIRRYLEHRPIQARPASITYRLTTMLRRNRALATGLGAAFAALVLGLGGMAWQAQTLAAERDRALRQTYSANLIAAGDAIARAEFAAGRTFLDAAPAALRGWEWRVLMTQLDTSVEVQARELPLPNPFALHLRPVAGGSKYWTLNLSDLVLGLDTKPGSAQLWERRSGRLLATLPGQRRWMMSPKADRLMGCHVHGSEPPQLLVSTYEAETGALLGEQIIDVPEIEQTALLKSWSTGACSPAGDACWFGTAGGWARASLPQLGANQTAADADPRAIAYMFAFRPDGKVAAFAPHQLGPVRVFDTETLALITTLSGHTNTVLSLTFSPDGTLLATTSGDQTARVWDLAASPPTCRVLQHPLEVGQAAFSPDQRLLATACIDHMIRVFRVADGTLVETFGSGKLLSQGVVFFDDRTVAGVESDRSVRYWDVEAAATTVLRGHQAPVEFLALVPALGLVASAGVEGYRGKRDGLKFWDVDSGDLVAECLGPQRVGKHLRLDPTGEALHFVQNGIEDEVQRGLARIDLRSGVRTVAPSSSVFSAWNLIHCAVDLSPSGQEKAIATVEDPDLRIVDAVTGEVRRRVEVSRSAFMPLYWSRDGAWILAGSSVDGADGVILLDAQSLREVRRFVSPLPRTFAVSAEERRVAVAGKDAIIRVFDVATGERLAELRGHDLEIFALAFSPDGTRLASSGHDRGIRLWDLQTFEPVARLSGHEDTVMAFVWDGNERLISTGHDDTVRIWETVPVRTRVQARNARREAVARVEPMVAALFAELGDGTRVCDRIDADVTLAPLERKVARQVALRMALAKEEGK